MTPGDATIRVGRILPNERKSFVNTGRLGDTNPANLVEAVCWITVAVGTLITERPPGGRRQSPASGSHRTQHADFPHWARQKLIHSLAIACSSG